MGAVGEKRRSVLAALVALALLLAGLGGCGDGDPTSAPPSSAEQSAGADGGGDATSGGAGEPSAASSQFGSPGADDSVQRSGEEASAAERQAASAVVLAFSRAAATGDRAKQCAYLAAEAIEPLERIVDPTGEGGRKGCAASLSQLSDDAAAAAGTTAPAGPIGSLRVEGMRGYALYHGKDDADYVMPLVKEGGEWKIASSPLELP